MRRSTAIVLGTWLGGVAVYAVLIYVFRLPPKEPGKTVGFVASFVAAAVIFTIATRRMVKTSNVDEHLTIEEMEKQGLLTREKHEATRAFQVEEFEDEGCQYFIELKNGSVLYLCGQYLYDHEPVGERAKRKQPRRFPCTEFTLIRDKRHGWIVDVVCGGTVFEPECIAPPLTEKEWASGQPGDGDIISDRSYDQLKREWLAGGQGAPRH